ARQRLTALQKSPTLLPSIMSDQEARDALRRGKVSLLIEGADTVVFRFDATRPDALGAKREADNALQSAAGRRDVVATREERVNGSIPLLASLSIIGGFSFSGIGLLTASRARTIEAVSGLMNLIMMPMWLCSGVFFSYERFPDSVKPIIRMLPLTLLNDGLRAVINDAAGVTQIASKLALLAVWGLVTFMIGLK